MKANQKQTRPTKRGGKQKSETLEERVHRHLSDINSKITDDDIRNVRTELEIRSEPPPAKEEATDEETTNEENKPHNKKTRKQEKENETDSKQETPWNLLSEGYD